LPSLRYCMGFASFVSGLRFPPGRHLHAGRSRHARLPPPPDPHLCRRAAGLRREPATAPAKCPRPWTLTPKFGNILVKSIVCRALSSAVGFCEDLRFHAYLHFVKIARKRRNADVHADTARSFHVWAVDRGQPWPRPVRG